MINPEKTAMKRKKISKPLRLLIEKNLISKDMKILDYGCGYGFDVNYLIKFGYTVEKYDSFYFNDKEVLNKKYDLILLNYVLNVIPNIEERVNVIKQCFKLSNKVLISVIKGSLKNPKPYNDGFITNRNTFQKFYTDEELVNFVNSIVKVKAIKLNPLIYLFELT